MNIQFPQSSNWVDFIKTRVETFGLAPSIAGKFLEHGIRTVGGIVNLADEEFIEIFQGKSGQVKTELDERFSELVTHIDSNIASKAEGIVDVALAVPRSVGSNATQVLPLDLHQEADIVRTMATALGYSPSEIIGKTRKQEIVRGRDYIVYLLRKYADMSFPAIGRILGGRDHTTIIHAYRKIEREALRNPILEEADPGLLSMIDALRNIKLRKLAIAEELRALEQSIRDSVAVQMPDRKRLTPLVKKISDRNNKVLELYREGLTYQNIGTLFRLSRERVRQIVARTIEQMAVNESAARGVVMDVSAMREEELSRRRSAKNAKKTKKTPKEKRWSLYYPACRKCGTTSARHVRRGLCAVCTGQVKGQLREDIISLHHSRCDVCGLPRGGAIRELGRDLYITNERKVLCRKCFLSFQGRKLGTRIRRSQ